MSRKIDDSLKPPNEAQNQDVAALESAASFREAIKSTDVAADKLELFIAGIPVDPYKSIHRSMTEDSEANSIVSELHRLREWEESVARELDSITLGSRCRCRSPFCEETSSQDESVVKNQVSDQGFSIYDEAWATPMKKRAPSSADVSCDDTIGSGSEGTSQLRVRRLDGSNVWNQICPKRLRRLLIDEGWLHKSWLKTSDGADAAGKKDGANAAGKEEEEDLNSPPEKGPMSSPRFVSRWLAQSLYGEGEGTFESSVDKWFNGSETIDDRSLSFRLSRLLYGHNDESAA